MTLTKAEQARRAEEEREEAIQTLRGWIKPGTTVYTSLNHVSRSGMYRAISLYIVRDGRILKIDHYAARAMLDKIDQRHGGIGVGGCGMDMGFHLVYSLGRTLFRDGFRCTGKNCPSNDHSNARRVIHRDDPEWVDDGRGMTQQPGYLGPAPRDGRMKHRGDAGYALNHQWI